MIDGLDDEQQIEFGNQNQGSPDKPSKGLSHIQQQLQSVLSNSNRAGSHIPANIDDGEDDIGSSKRIEHVDADGSLDLELNYNHKNIY